MHPLTRPLGQVLVIAVVLLFLPDGLPLLPATAQENEAYRDLSALTSEKAYSADEPEDDTAAEPAAETPAATPAAAQPAVSTPAPDQPFDAALPPEKPAPLSEGTSSETNVIARRPVDVKLFEAFEDMNNEKYSEAIPKFEWVIEQDPTLLNAWESLGWAYWRVGRKQEMINLWKRLEALTPSSPFSHNLLAKAYIAQGQMDLAAEHLKKSLELDPTQYEMRYAYARVMLWRGRAEEAIPMFRQLLKEDPDRMDVRLHLARALDADRQYEESLELWAQARAIAPDNPEYLVREAYALLRVGDLNGATMRAEELLSWDENNVQAQMILADAAEYGDKTEEAVKKLQNIVDKSEDYDLRMGLLNRTTTLQLRLNRQDPLKFPVDDIIKTAKKALDIDPRSVTFHLLIADLYLMKGEYRAGVDEYQKVLDEYNPHNRRSFYGLFQAYLALQKYDEAEKYLRLAESFNPDDPFRYYHRALLEQGRGHSYEAFEALDRLELEGARGAVFCMLYHGLTPSEYMPAPSARRFRDQMMALKKAGFEFLTPDQINAYLLRQPDPPSLQDHSLLPSLIAKLKFLFTGRRVTNVSLNDFTPVKAVSVTFDDALRSSFRWGTSVADELDIAIGMHIPVGNILNYDSSICSWEELRYYENTGRWVMGSHLIDASTLAPVDKEGYKVRTLPNRLWNAEKNRQESMLEYLLRIQRECKLSQQLISQELGTNRVPFMAYPMGDLGQEDFCNVESAIRSILLEVDLVYDIGFIQTQFGFAVKGDNPLLYQRHEMERWEDGRDVLRFIYEHHPVYVARNMRARMAALQGRPHMAMRMVEELKRDGCPEETLKELSEYVETHVSNQEAQPKHTTKVESKKRQARIQLKEPYLGVNYEELKDNGETEEKHLYLRGGLNVTPQLTMELRLGQGKYKHVNQETRTEKRVENEERASTVTTETDTDGTVQTTTTRTTTMSETTVYTNIITREPFSADETFYLLMANYKYPSGPLLSFELGQRSFTSDSPSNEVSGLSSLTFAAQYGWKPTLVTETIARYDYNVIPTLRKLVDYNAFSMSGYWIVSDYLTLSGRGQYQMLGDGNNILLANARNMYLLSEKEGFYIGLEGEFANADKKSDDYWAPHWRERLYAVGELRRSYQSSFFALTARYGMGREEGWQEDVDRYEQNRAQGEVYGYYPGENPTKDWESIIGMAVTMNRKFWRHWEFNAQVSINELTDYTDRNFRIGLLYNF